MVAMIIVAITVQVWDDANKKALEIASSIPGAQYISPFDNPLIW